MLLLPFSAAYSQKISTTNAVIISATDPTGNACSATSPNLTYGTGNTRNLYTCQSGVYAVSTGSGSVPDASLATKGKAKKGAKARYTIATLPTCDAALAADEVTVKITDGNKGERRCSETRTGVYEWVDTRPVFDVRSFGANPSATAATNVTYILAAITAANSVAGGGVVEISGGTYQVNAAIALLDNVTLRGNGTITQTTNNTSIFTITSKSNIQFEGLHFIGVGSDFNNGISDPARAISATSVTDLSVNNCTFVNFANSAINVTGNGLKFTNLKIVGIGLLYLTPVTSGASYGIALNGNCDDVFISGCTISETAQGIASGVNITNARIAGNYLYNIRGQHGIYLGGDGIENVAITGNTVDTARLIGIKVQSDGAGASPIKNISITGNTVIDAQSTGIAVLSGTYTPVALIDGVTVTGNTVLNGGESDGINIQSAKNGVVSNNQITTITRDGLSLTNATNFLIANNNIRSIGESGIRVYEVTGTTGELDFVNNKIYQPGTAAAASAHSGIRVTSASGRVDFRQNNIQDTAAKMQYGIFREGGTQTSDHLVGNIVVGATDFSVRLQAAAVAEFRDNYLPQGVQNLPTTNQWGNTGRQFYSTAVPSSGAWLRGDIVWNYTPSLNNVVAWICTTAGTPGTWTTLYALGTDASPTFNSATLTSSASTTVLTATTNTAAEADIGIFKQSNASGFGAVRIDRPSTVRYALTKYSTADTVDWMAGVAYGGGGANSDYSVGQTINLSDYKFKFNTTTGFWLKTALNFNALAFSLTAPTVTSAGSSPSIVSSNGTASFRVDVGTGGTAHTVVLGMPAAANGWNCSVNNLTAAAANRADWVLRQTASTTTSVTIQMQSGTLGMAQAFAANDIISCQCVAH